MMSRMGASEIVSAAPFVFALGTTPAQAKQAHHILSESLQMQNYAPDSKTHVTIKQNSDLTIHPLTPMIQFREPWRERWRCETRGRNTSAIYPKSNLHFHRSCFKHRPPGITFVIEPALPELAETENEQLAPQSMLPVDVPGRWNRERKRWSRLEKNWGEKDRFARWI